MLKGRSNGQGFSLIEMIVVLAILAVLVTLAMPSYQASLRKARRVEGKFFLHALMMAEERYHGNFNRYTSDLGPKGLAQPEVSLPRGYYTVSRLDLELSAQFIRIAVSPQGVQSDDPCGELTLDSTGLFQAYGGPVDECG
jgi:type IV pilus assembly protein PilE